MKNKRCVIPMPKKIDPYYDRMIALYKERLAVKNAIIETMTEALERAHELLTAIPDWPDTEHDHFVSEIIESALTPKETP